MLSNKKAQSFLSPFDFICLLWPFSELGCRQRLSLERKYNDSVKRLRLERFGSPTRYYETTINLAEIELTLQLHHGMCI